MGICMGMPSPPEIPLQQQAINIAVELRARNRQLTSARNLLIRRHIATSQSMRFTVEASIQNISEIITNLEMELEQINNILISKGQMPILDEGVDPDEVNAVISKALCESVRFPPVPTHPVV
jgi:hypothetical protein